MRQSPTPSAGTAPTRESLLAAAERLFAEHGIGNASLRAITREAGANLASVHYHFGSKEALVRAVFARRVGPLNRQRLALLDDCERDAGDGGADLACVVRAFVGPFVRMMSNPDPGLRDFTHLVGRAFTHPDAEPRRLLVEELREVRERFLAALGATLPELSAGELTWRFHFMIGALGHIAAGRGVLAEDPVIGHDPIFAPEGGADEALTRRLVAFLDAAMRAPAADRAADCPETPR